MVLEASWCPSHTVSDGTREGTDSLTYLGHPSTLTLAFPAVCQGKLSVSWSLHALVSADRRGSREAVLQRRRAFTVSCLFLRKRSFPITPLQQ